MNNQQIILASASPQRQKLLSILNLPFTVVPSATDEKTIRDTDLSLRAEKIARAKAEAVAKKHRGIVIAADTFCAIGDHVLEKPPSIEEAKAMLRLLSGNTHVCYTGFCYIDRQNNIDQSCTTLTTATFRLLSEQEIDVYVQKFPVTTWSAAYYPGDPYSSTFVASIEGSLTGYLSLPMEHLIPLLAKSGYVITPSFTEAG